jgi:hypothetical protein
MADRMCQNLLKTLLGTGFVVNLLTGCGGTNLNGYRPAREHSAETVTATTPKPPELNGNPAEPARITTLDGAPESDGNSTAPASLAEGAQNDASVLPVSALVPVNVVDGANVRALMSIPANEPGNSPKTSSNPPAVTNEPTDVAPISEPRKVEVLVKDKTFRTESKTGAARVSFDDLDLLKVLNMEPVVENAVELMPDWLQKLSGKTIRIRGYMYPTYDTEGIEKFVLARDNQICCFGRDPKIYDLVQVNMKDGKSTHYIPASRAFDVVGKFKIEMHSQDGKPYGLYVIDQADVIDR